MPDQLDIMNKRIIKQVAKIWLWNDVNRVNNARSKVQDGKYNGNHLANLTTIITNNHHHQCNAKTK